MSLTNFIRTFRVWKDWYEINDKYYLGQIFTENNQKYIVIVGAETAWVKHFDLYRTNCFWVLVSFY
jgi:hypothetical protein